MSAPEDRLEVTFRHGLGPDPTVMRVVVEGVDLGAVQRDPETGEWRPQQPEPGEQPSPDRDTAAVDVLREAGIASELAQAAVNGGLNTDQRDELRVTLGVARRRMPGR